jgi:prepilin-type N-terminal cleavage/methylation domain-containing protein
MTYVSIHQKGFTLIELLLYMVIVSTLLLAVTSFYISASSARTKNQSISEVNSQGIFIMNSITQTVRSATAVTTPAFGASGTSLTLSVPTAALSPTIYTLTGSTLTIKEGSSAEVALNSPDVQVSNVTIKNLSSKSGVGNVQIIFTLTRTNNSGRNEYDYQKTFTSTASQAW